MPGSSLERGWMILAKQRAQLKNRIHATLAKYALTIREVSDPFGVRGRRALRKRIAELPEQTRFATERLLEQLERVGWRSN